MSENKFDLNVKIDAPEKVVDTVTMPVEKVLNPVAKSIGDGLSSIINCIFNPFHYMDEKQKLKYGRKLQLLKEEIDHEINKIPEEKLCAPDLQTVGNALENSKFCIETDELRAMFVKLISNSANIDNKNLVHPAFASMIKEMNSLDAEILTLFKTKTTWPIAEYHIKVGDSGHTVLQTNVLLYESKRTNDITQIASSLSNLNRLGLIEINYLEHLIEDGKYVEYDKFLDTYKATLTSDETLSNKYSIQKGAAKITPLGSAFISVCISA